MPYEFSLPMLPLLIATLLSGAIGWYTWRHRHTSGATPFSVLMWILFQWGISYILQLAATDLPTKFLWDKIMFLGVVATPVAWLTFAVEYIGRKAWINPRRLVLLSILPVITTIVIWTSDWHALFWKSYELVEQGGFLLLKTDNGIWFWVHAAYTYLLIMVGLVLIIRALLHWPAQYRAQMVFVLISTLTPLIANAITIFQILPIYIDLTPFAFIVTGIGMAYAMFRHRLLDIAPIARDIVINGMKDGMIILDADRRIVDLNPAAQEILGFSGAKQPIGKSIAEVLAQWPELIQRYRNVEEAQDEISAGVAEAQRWF